jgi:hypothetical protein
VTCADGDPAPNPELGPGRTQLLAAGAAATDTFAAGQWPHVTSVGTHSVQLALQLRADKLSSAVRWVLLPAGAGFDPVTDSWTPYGIPACGSFAVPTGARPASSKHAPERVNPRLTCQGVGGAGDTTVTHRIDGIHEPHLVFYGLQRMHRSCLDGAVLEPDTRYDLWVAPELTPANARRMQFHTGAPLKHTRPSHTSHPHRRRG